MTKSQKIEEVLTRGVEKIYPSKNALKNLLTKNKKIKLYQGFDPSMPNLHLGNLVGILKLKQFQDLGHKVIFLVGDFTGMIGDPTGKIEGARPQLTHQQVLKNAKSYKKQAGRILNFSGKNPAKIQYNSKWLSNLSVDKLAGLMRHLTYSQIIKRDMFQKRIEKGKDILLSEFFYPFMQAYDSVYMNVDLEIGGSDQMFNMLVGRQLMKKLKNKEKFVLTTKLLIDKQGEKIGKTTGNALFLNAKPDQMFGAIMNFPDEVIILGFELLTFIPLQQINDYKNLLNKKNINPMILKKELGFEIVKLNYGKQKAQKAQMEFERIFKEKKLPTKIPEIIFRKEILNILDILLISGLAQSKSQGKRLILQGGVKIDNEIQKDCKKQIKIKKGMILQIGKRKFIKVI
ncbi:MAG: tyrosine--tRNA ligase [Candidatus Pacebacteria bacterium]|nr:tyrosine--tRNA ligase [Candidatus Paceibacterota bacterium]